MFADSKSLLAGDLFFHYRQDSTPALGLVVSRKYGNAVQRHLLKRRCRTQFQKMKNLGFTYSIIVSPKKSNLGWVEIKSSFNQLLAQLHV